MTFRRFAKDRRGNVAPIFAFTLVPMIGLIGASVDYTRASAVRVSLQAAVDATALAVSKNAASTAPATIQTNATNYFNGIFSGPGANVTITYSGSPSQQLVARGTASVPTTFLSVVGFPKIDVAATSTVAWSLSKLRIALVLDNTGSMAQNGKMTALKQAAHNLITQMQKAAKSPGDIYVSIVPFATDVNIGTGFASQPWIDWSNWAATGSIENGMVCGSGKKGTGTTVCGGANHTGWNGCVMDRSQNNDTTNTPPTSANALTYFPADQSAWCPSQITPLSYDWTALGKAVDAMQPAGNTNQTIGLSWGWMSLSQSAPLNAPPLDPNYQYQQVIILLTDGLNTENRWSTSQAAVDKRTTAACNNIKADGITVYTVLVMSGDSSLLQGCASDAGKYFALTSANQIVTTFDQIGTSLVQLHLAR